MKNSFFVFLFLSLSFSVNSQTIPEILTIDASNFEDEPLNILGLNTVEIQIKNNDSIGNLINGPAYILCEIQVWPDTNGNTWISFYEGNLMFASKKEMVTIQPNAIINYKLNVNLFEVLRLKNILNIEEKTKCKIRFGIFSRTYNKNYYSKPVVVEVEPLSKMDMDASQLIDSLGYDSHDFTNRGTISVFGLNPVIAQIIIDQYPESSFAEIASLSLLRNEVLIAVTPQDKANALILLSKPLASKFSFIRLLAEELKMKL